MKLENVPGFKGKGIPQWIYDWIKRSQLEDPKVRKASMSTAEKKMISKLVTSKEVSSTLAHVYTYQHSPTKFG